MLQCCVWKVTGDFVKRISPLSPPVDNEIVPCPDPITPLKRSRAVLIVSQNETKATTSSITANKVKKSSFLFPKIKKKVCDIFFYVHIPLQEMSVKVQIFCTATQKRTKFVLRRQRRKPTVRQMGTLSGWMNLLRMLNSLRIKSACEMVL